jgi:hypothetical protein
VERRGQVIGAAVALVNRQREEPTGCGGGRQPLIDETSRVIGDYQARFCGGLEVKLRGATRPLATRAVPGPSFGPAYCERQL